MDINRTALETLEDSLATEFGSDVTNYGLNKFARAALSEEKVLVTQFAVGDGNGEAYIPDKSATELKNEQWRGSISKYEITQEDPTQIKILGTIPANIGTFFIREFGIFDDEGGMIAVGNTPAIQKIKDESGAALSLSLTLYIQFENCVTDQLVIRVVPEAVEKLKDRVDVIEEKLNLKEVDEEDIEKIFGLSGDEPSYPKDWVEASDEDIDALF